ncbi:MAG: GNAT family N-acetyltransferase [Aquaticitalea sp.]
MEIKQNKENKEFTMDVQGETAKVDYEIRNGKMYLVYSEVPPKLRGQGIGKQLVEQTFEKLTEEGYEAVAVCGYIKSVKNSSEKWKKIIS